MLDGRTAYAARFKGESPRNFTPFDELSQHGREIWQGIEEAVRLEVIKPIAGWREAGAEDPHGTRYDCTREQLAGGHLTDDQVAFAIASTFRSDVGLEGVLAVARDRIRWLSRRLAGIETQLASMTQHYVDSACEAYSLKLAAAGCDDVAEHVNSVTIDDVARWRTEQAQEIASLRRGLSAAEKSRDAAVRDANGMREELALRASKITALKADRDLPPLGLPPGTIQAYSEAYKACYKPADHIGGHIAGLRAVLTHFLEGCEPEESCIACDLTLQEGDMVLSDASGGFIHVACCGPDRESFTGPDGEPLKDGGPIPTGFPWKAQDAEPTPYTVLATIYDGTQILAPATLSDRYSQEEIQAAIKDLVARARGPRSGDMADVVDAINGEGAR